VRLSELTNVYATLAAGGRFSPLTFVKRIIDPSGHDVRLPRGDGARDVLTPAELAAYEKRAAELLPPDDVAWLEGGGAQRIR